MLPQESKSLTELDQEIEMLELKARRNMLRPLCCLPVEILGLILYFSQIPLRVDVNGSRYIRTRLRTYDRCWTEYTRVCRRIRSVALETPYLWTFIEINRVDKPSAWTELCARRAKDCLLEIYVPADHSIRSTGMGVHLGRYLGRARSLEAYMTQHQPHMTNSRSQHAIVNMSMPVLEEMHCGMAGNLLNAEFMGGSCSSLLSLKLYDFAFALHKSTPNFPVLRRLELFHRSRTEEISQFIILFHHTPCLEALSIDTSSTRVVINEVDTLVPVPLSHLRTFHLKAPSSVIRAFIAIFPVPHDELSIDVTRQGHHEVDSPVPEFHTYLSRFWSTAAEGRRFPLGIIDWTSRNSFHVVIGSKFAFDTNPGSLGPRIFFSCWVDTSGLTHDILELVESLHVGEFSTDPANQVFSALNNHHIRYLVVENIVYVRDLPRGLDPWLRERARVGHPLETVTFIGSSTLRRGGTVQDFADELRRDGLARNVVWTRMDTT
jgi:hypothetical protein